MNGILRIILVAVVIALAAGFNVGLIDVRLDEIRYLIGKITVDQDITKTFDIVAKYELIKRRMLYGEDDLRNFEIEAKVAALTSGDEDDGQKTSRRKIFYQLPVRWLLNTIRFTLGKEIINPREDDQIVKVLQVGYFWERNRTYAEAIKVYEKVLGMTGINPEIKAAVLVHKAFCHSMLGEYDVSKDIYEQVINLYPNTDAGVLAWKLLDFIESMEKERKDLQNRELSDFDKAKQFYLLMDYRNAIKYISLYLQAARPSDAGVIESRYYKGRSHEELGEIQDATNEYSFIIRNDTQKNWARQANRRMIMLGSFYEQKQQLADEAKKQLAAYQDEAFMNKMEQYTSMVKESSLRRELLGSKVAVAEAKSSASDSIMNLINKIGNLDLTGEEARQKQQKQIEEMKKELIDKGVASAADIKEFERMQLLRDNPYRRPTAFKKVVDENAGQLKYIYNKRLRSGARLEGKIEMEIKINPAGAVTAARIMRSNVGDPQFEKDVLDCVQKWSFAPVPDSLGTLTVNYPFEFSEEQ